MSGATSIGGRLRGAAGARRPGRALLAPAVFALSTVLLAFPAYWRMFTNFAKLDDEGYLLQTLRAFTAGRTLYTDIFTQYGPFYYEIFGAPLALSGRVIGMDVGRLLTIGMWLLASLMLGVAAYRLTRRLWLGLAVQLLAFSILDSLRNEPMHPVGLISLLLTATVLVLVVLMPRRPAAALAGAGAIAACVALTKINVGGFVLIALALACALVLPGIRSLAPLRWALIGLGVLLAPLLVLPDLGNRDVQTFALLVTAGVVALVIVSFDAPVQEAADRAHVRWLGALAAGAALAVILVFAGILLTGVTPRALFEALVLDPTGQRDVLFSVLKMPPQTVPWAFGLVAVALATRYLRWPAAVAGWAGGAVRVLAGVVMLLALGSVPLGGPTGLGLKFGPELTTLGTPVLFAWIAAIPPGEVSLRERLARVAIVAVAVLQALHAYPVAGTQVFIGSLLLILPGALILSDGLRQLDLLAVAAAPRAGARRAGGVVSAAAAVLVLGCSVFAFAINPATATQPPYANNPKLPFSTADLLRLGPGETEQYKRVVDTVRDQCTSFLTWPGMNSLYVWSGLPPVTDLNPTDWSRLLDDERQQRVVDAAEAQRVRCVVRNPELQLAWDVGRPPRSGPLTRYIESRFVLGVDLGGGYQLFLRK
jgi:hypothetical protein